MGLKPRCPQNPKKGFVLNDSEVNKRFMEVKDSCMPCELMVESLHYLTLPYSMVQAQIFASVYTSSNFKTIALLGIFCFTFKAQIITNKKK